MLSDEQKVFLERYVNSRGDFYKTMESMGLEINHIILWRQNIEFDNSYRNCIKEVSNFLKDENRMIALRNLNDVLKFGVTQHTTKKTHINGEEGGTYKVETISKKLGVPSWAIKEGLTEYSIIKAIDLLASEGVIPHHVAKKLLSAGRNIEEKMINSFDAGNTEEKINREQAISLIKQAILAPDNES